MLKNVETTNVDVEISRRYFYMNTRSLETNNRPRDLRARWNSSKYERISILIRSIFDIRARSEHDFLTELLK